MKPTSKSTPYSIWLSVLMAAEELPIPTVDDITRLTQNVSCADNRLEPHMTSHNPDISNLLLIGRIISRRNFHAPVLHDIVMRAWNPSRHISVRKVDRNTFVFSFEHETDRALAYNRRPWTIRGAHLVLKIWSPDLALTEIDFTSSTFWVQVHGLPPIWYNKENIKLVGNKAGSVVVVDFSESPSGIWQRFARVRVNVNVNKPLCPGVFLPRHERTDIWISLKYERLPEYCLRCGILGHTEVHCETNKVFLTNEFGRKFPAFGEWLHCGNDKTPPGIYEKPPITQAIPVLEVMVPDQVQNASLVQVAVQASETAGHCEDTPRSTEKDNLVHPSTAAGMGEVLSFARLLQHSHKDACPANRASTSMSHINMPINSASYDFGHGPKNSYSVGPPKHSDPQRPVNTHQTSHPSMDPTKVLPEPTISNEVSPIKVLIEPTKSIKDSPFTDPPDAQQFNLSIQSQVPCTLEASLYQIRPHTTNSTEPRDTEDKTNFPISPKAVSAPTPLFEPEIQPSSPINPANQPTFAPAIQAETPPNPINQTPTPPVPAIQEVSDTPALKRKEHPDLPTTTLKKLRCEDACFETSCSQLWDFQLSVNEVVESYKDEESSRTHFSLVNETGLHPSPKAQ